MAYGSAESVTYFQIPGREGPGVLGEDGLSPQLANAAVE